MATPQFHSQHSEILINVSENHSSTKSTPQAKPKQQPTQVAQSPSIRDTQSEACVPESLERVEDSYKESQPNAAPVRPVDEDEEEDLYAVSPTGKAKLEATVAAKRSAQVEQPAKMPTRNPIEALLSQGATAAPLQPIAPVSKDSLRDRKDASSPACNYKALDAKLRAIKDSADKVVKETTKSRKRKSDDADFEPDKSNGDDDEDQDQDIEKEQAKGKSKRLRPLVTDPDLADELPTACERSGDTAQKPSTIVNGLHNNNGEATTTPAPHEENRGSIRHMSASAENSAGKGHVNTAHETTQTLPADPLVENRNGRPGRQAKTTALGKLKVRHSKANGDAVIGVDDQSGDDIPNITVKGKRVNDTTERGQPMNQLPIPVTKSYAPKKGVQKQPNGKLQSVKSKAPPTTARVSKPSKSKTRPDDSASTRRTSYDTTLVGGESVVSSTEIEPEESTAKVPKNTIGDEQVQLGGKLPSRRPGSLKRPVRSDSRGRKPLRGSLYEFPSDTPRVKKKKSGRSVSRATRVSTVKAGAARQRMQSESIKDRKDRKDRNIDTSPRAMISRKTSPDHKIPPDPPRKMSAAQSDNKNARQPSKSINKDDKENQPEVTDNTVKMQNTAVKASSALSRQKPGSSQANAITVEQGPSSSSSPPSSPPSSLPQDTARSNATIQAIPRPKGPRPQTPALMPSSPPGLDRETFHTLASDKPTIIAFGRQGPRNQGTTPARKKPGSAFSSKAASVYDTGEVGSSDVHDGISKLATTLFPTQNQAHVEPQKQAPFKSVPSNVSMSGEDVFGDFTKGGKNTALASMLQRSQSAAKKSAQQARKSDLWHDDDDDGFAVIDDFDGTTLVDNEDDLPKTAEQRTASQIAMPPPNAAEKTTRKNTLGNPLLSKPAKKAAKSLVVSTAPEVKHTKETAKPMTVKGEIGSAPVKKATKTAMKPATKTISKDQLPELKPPEKAAKTQKVAKTLPSNITSKPELGKLSSSVPPVQPKRKRGPDEMQVPTSAKKAKMSQTQMVKVPGPSDASPRQLRSSKMPQVTSALVVDPVKRVDRRRSGPSRRTTQGSQGVDILGSPYPKDFQVPTQTTALETFSQQAGLSSDEVVRSDLEAGGNLAGRLNLAAVPRMSPTIRPKLLSSNGKPIPAAPQESSKAVTRIASGPFAEHLLIAANHKQRSTINPFTSSSRHDSTAKPGVDRITGFKDSLRRQGIVLDHEGPNMDCGLEGDDPDTTLVEPAKDHRQSERPGSSPSARSTSSASTTSAAGKALEDVGDWRNTLKSHQVHLFDSLVIAAHKLVRHMVDEETASRDIVADYRRRGEIVVTELQRAHADKYQKYAAGMQDGKKRAADQLAAHGKQLKQSMRDTERARAEKKKAKRSRSKIDVMLEELVAGLD